MAIPTERQCRDFCSIPFFALEHARRHRCCVGRQATNHEPGFRCTRRRVALILCACRVCLPPIGTRRPAHRRPSIASCRQTGINARWADLTTRRRAKTLRDPLIQLSLPFAPADAGRYISLDTTLTRVWQMAAPNPRINTVTMKCMKCNDALPLWSSVYTFANSRLASCTS